MNKQKAKQQIEYALDEIDELRKQIFKIEIYLFFTTVGLISIILLILQRIQ